GPSDGAPVADDASFTETAVVVHADGTRTVTQQPLTAAKEREQNAARATYFASRGQAKVILDSACAPRSFWLYDQPGEVGNRICFWGEDPYNTNGGPAPLADYTRPDGSTWQIRSGSIASGCQQGWLGSDGEFAGAQFGAHETADIQVPADSTVFT